MVQPADALALIILVASLEAEADVTDRVRIDLADGLQELLHRPRLAGLEGDVCVPDGTRFEIELATGGGERKYSGGVLIGG